MRDAEQRDAGDLRPGDGREFVRLLRFKLMRGGQRVGEECLLQGAPDVGDADDDADAGSDGPPGIGAPRADQNLQLGDEAGEAGQPHGRDAGDDKGPGGEGQSPREVHGFKLGELARVGAVVDDAADDGEEQAGDDAVREHLQHRAVDADLVERHQAEQHKAHVADAGVADDEFEVGLRERDERAVDDADDGEPARRRRARSRGRGT